ncbi:MAG: helix-turn-helix transcriptional regulator [Bacteroidales bacterium]|jgi:hypothetical protein|nr:helix-turn-helix transcriptional regulator [Bacteroidales bacterium]
MAQLYHQNVETNVHIRSEIQKSNLTNFDLSDKYNVSKNTISKWKNRESIEDRSSRTNTICYALNNFQKDLIISIRKTIWLALDEIWKCFYVKS